MKIAADPQHRLWSRTQAEAGGDAPNSKAGFALKQGLRWTAYLLASASLGSAVLYQGGVQPRQWQWCALGISVAALLLAAADGKPRRVWDPWDRAGLLVMAALAAWMILPLAPLPLALVRILSPHRWAAVTQAARLLGGAPPHWVSLSLAPAATLERLLDVLPALAMFVMARDLAWQHKRRMWIAAVPVIAIALGEGLLGCIQFLVMRATSGDAVSATGTYVNRNHFAGLLEMGLPLVLMAAVAAWRRREPGSLGHSLTALSLAGSAACLFAGIVVSLSRAGFLSALAALGIVVLACGFPWETREGAGRNTGRNPLWRWATLPGLLLLLALMVPTKELRQRIEFTPSLKELGTDTRVAIWRDTAHLIGDFKWIGTGAGAYERGLYLYKTAKPTNTVDFAHNDYLQILAEFGIPGALLIGALMIWIGGRCLAAALSGRGAPNWELSVGLLGAFTAIGLHSLADFNLYIPANALALAWLAGLAVSPALRKH